MKHGDVQKGRAFKFTSIPLLSPPETGAMEFFDGRWYLTGTAKQRVIDRTGGVIVATTTVASSSVETTLWAETLSANAMKVGRIYKLFCDGILSAEHTSDEITFNVYMGSTLLATVTPAGHVFANDLWHLDFNMTIRTTGNSGTAACHGHIVIHGTDVGFSLLHAVDTVAANTISVKVKWNASKAGNTISIYQGWLELKN